MNLNLNLINIFLLILFSFYINFYYSSSGVLAQDTFAYYDVGYRVMNGDVPFKDYWTVSGPFIDYLQSALFYLFGVNWGVYILNGSIINVFITVLFYQVLKNYNLNIFVNLFYSICFSILANPSMGTAFPDHYSTFLSLAGIFFYFLAIKKKNCFYWLIIPILFFFSFFCKQTPSAYLLIIIIILSSLYIFFYKKIHFIKYFIIGSSICLLSFFSFLYFNEIDFNNFLVQYIYFPQTIGQSRYKDLVFTSNLFLNFKFIFIFIFFILYKLIYLFLNFKNSNKDKENIIIISFLIFLSIILIFHQILTKNFIFIFFLIPLLGSFIHIIYFDKKRKNSYLEILLILLTLFSTVKYHLRFNEHRKMLNLEKVDLNKTKDASGIHSSLKGLNWITNEYSLDPFKEIKLLTEMLYILKNDKSKKMLSTQYLFFSSILDENLNNPSRWPSISDASNPDPSNKYHEHYIKFIENLIEKKNINTLYSTTTLEKEDIFYFIYDNHCKQKKIINEILIKYDIRNCRKLR